MGRLDDELLEGKLLLFVGDLLTVLLLTAGTAIAFVSGYDLRLDLGAVMMFCVFTGAASTVLHRLDQPWGALGTAAGIALIFWLFWEKIAPPLWWILRKMNLFSGAFGENSLLYVPGKGEALPVFLLLCAVLAWLMGWIAVRTRRWYLGALLPLALMMPAIQSGVLPAWGAMLAVFAGWGSMLLTSLYGRKDPGSLGRAQLLSLGGMTALILLLVAALPRENYTRPQWATKARTNLIQGVSDGLGRFVDWDELDGGILADLGLDLSISGQDGNGNGVTASGYGDGTGLGGSGVHEDLLHAGPRRYSGQRILSVVSEQKAGGRIYLRGNSLGVYTGASWEMVQGGYPFFPEDASIPPMSQPSLYPTAASDGSSYMIRIRDVLHQGVLYYPYQLMPGDWWLTESGKLTLADAAEEDILPSRELRYEVSYVPGSPPDAYRPLTGSWEREELAYRQEIVQSVYLDVPDGTRDLLSILVDAGLWELIEASLEAQIELAEGEERETLESQLEELQAVMGGAATLMDFGGPVELRSDMEFRERFESTVTAASRTAQLLDAIAKYDANTPAMGEGYDDFMAGFLTEKRGYCIHFATAGTLLLRMQGIPARYVTGYVADLSANGEGTVLDSDAHAWVEVYIDGYGWYPVEMTPGYAGGEDGVSLAGAPEDTEADETEEPDDEKQEDKADTPEEQPEEDPEKSETPGEETAEDMSGFVFPWKAALGTLLALGALAGVYALSFLPRELARGNEDINRSVISAYRRYSRGLRWGGEENEILEELGRKAKFSQHILTEEERETAWKELDGAAGQIRRRQPKWRKALFPLMRPFL